MNSFEHAAWCVNSEDSAVEYHPVGFADPHTCFGPEHHTPISGAPRVTYNDGSSEPEYIEVSAQRALHSEDRVHIGKGELAPLALLTPAEAAHLVAALQATLAEIGA